MLAIGFSPGGEGYEHLVFGLIELVDLDRGRPVTAGASRSKLSAWDGIPEVPPPIGPARAVSKLIDGIIFE